MGKLVVTLLPMVMDIVGYGRREEELRTSIDNVHERLGAIEEHLDSMYLSLRREIRILNLYLKVSMALNLLLLVLLMVVLIRIW